MKLQTEKQLEEIKAEIWNKHYATRESFDKGMDKFYRKAKQEFGYPCPKCGKIMQHQKEIHTFSCECGERIWYVDRFGDVTINDVRKEFNKKVGELKENMKIKFGDNPMKPVKIILKEINKIFNSEKEMVATQNNLNPTTKKEEKSK